MSAAEGFELGFALAVGDLGFVEDVDEVFGGADYFAGFVDDCDGLADERHGC